MTQHEDLLDHFIQERWSADNQLRTVQENRVTLKVCWERCSERLRLVARAGVVGSLNSNHFYSPG